MKKMESHHPYGEKVHKIADFGKDDHLCPVHKGVAPLPDSQRETWMNEDSYPKQPDHGLPNVKGKV